MGNGQVEPKRVGAVSAVVLTMANPGSAIGHLIRIAKAVRAYLDKARFVQKHPSVTDLLEEAGMRFERRRLKGESLSEDDREFFRSVRAWAKASGLSDSSIWYFIELGKEAARKGGRP